jgi:hypothetical protein
MSKDEILVEALRKVVQETFKREGEILIIEPYEDIRNWIESYCRYAGYNVQAFPLVQDAMDYYPDSAPDILIVASHDDRGSEQIDNLARHFGTINGQIQLIYLIDEVYRDDHIGFFIKPISILKQPLTDDDRLKLRKWTEYYRSFIESV